MLLELNNIRLAQGDFTLQVPELGLKSAQLYVLQGENGSGKSTLLRLMALLQQPQSGEVRYAGEPVVWRSSKLRQFRQKITLLEQTPWLFNGTVEKNLAFGLKLRAIQGKELHRQIDQALAIVGLDGFKNRRAKELSGGESRRVALARALCLKPQLLLLDEPTANLDSSQLEALERFLAELPEQGMSLVIASHDTGQSQRLGGETIKLSNGQLLSANNATPPIKRLKVV
jgi:tungstate transport system ATP-binding protein